AITGATGALVREVPRLQHGTSVAQSPSEPLSKKRAAPRRTKTEDSNEDSEDDHDGPGGSRRNAGVPASQRADHRSSRFGGGARSSDCLGRCSSQPPSLGELPDRTAA